MIQGKNQLTVLESVDSTNNYAMGQVHAGVAAPGEAWLALEQTQGKGQHGKVWQAAKGDNITISIALAPEQLPIQQQFRVSATVATACHAFLQAYAGDNVYIKWPNDVYWNDRKAGGILIENILQGQTWKWAIAGIGLNINQMQFPKPLSNPVSLRMITGNTYTIASLAEELHQKVLFYWQQLAGGNWHLIHHYYNRFLYKKGTPVQILSNGQSFTGTPAGITEDGALLIEERNEPFTYGSIRVAW